MTNNHISAVAVPEKTHFVVLEIQAQSCVRCLASGLQGQRWTMHLMVVVVNTMDPSRYLEILEALRVFLAGVGIEPKVQVASVLENHVSLPQMTMTVVVGRQSEEQEEDGVALSLMYIRVACSLCLQLHLLASHQVHP